MPDCLVAARRALSKTYLAIGQQEALVEISGVAWVVCDSYGTQLLVQWSKSLPVYFKMVLRGLQTKVKLF